MRRSIILLGAPSRGRPFGDKAMPRPPIRNLQPRQSSPHTAAGRSTIILQVQREIFRNGRCRCEKLQCRRPQIMPHSAGRYVTSRPARHQRSRRDRRAYYPSPSRLAPAAPSERGRLFVRGKRAAMSGVSAAHPRGHASSPNPSGTGRPKCAPAAKPPQLHQAGYTHQRETHAKHPTQTQWRSQPQSAPAA